VLVGPAGGSGPLETVASIQADDARIAAESRAAVLDLYSLDARLATAQARLFALQAEAATLRTEEASIRRSLALARLDARLSQDRLAQRLRYIYEHGTTSSLDVVLGARSLGDAMTELDDFDRVAASNADVLSQVLTAKRHLAQLRRELASRERTLAATTRDASGTVATLGEVRAARVTYIAGLAARQSLDARRIASLEAEAQAAVVKTETIAPAPSGTPAPSVTATPSTTPSTAVAPTPVAPSLGFQGRSLTVSATAYHLPGNTASGLPVGWGVVAVDPSVIPLGTHLTIPGYGEAVAADTGTAIVGARIDLWFPTDAQAAAWGRRTVTIAVN
jgi:cystine transport system substrate-binding protein